MKKRTYIIFFICLLAMEIVVMGVLNWSDISYKIFHLTANPSTNLVAFPSAYSTATTVTDEPTPPSILFFLLDIKRPSVTPTPTATATLTPSNTPKFRPVPPTDTPVPPINPIPTNTPRPTNTTIPTNTLLPTNTPVPPTNTLVLPTKAPSPTVTTVLPTNTPVPPTPVL